MLARGELCWNFVTHSSLLYTDALSSKKKIPQLLWTLLGKIIPHKSTKNYGVIIIVDWTKRDLRTTVSLLTNNRGSRVLKALNTIHLGTCKSLTITLLLFSIVILPQETYGKQFVLDHNFSKTNPQISNWNNKKVDFLQFSKPPVFKCNVTWPPTISYVSRTIFVGYVKEIIGLGN